MDARLALFLAVVVFVAAAGAVAYRRKRARVRGERGALFRDVWKMFDGVEEAQDDVDFPVLTGERAGHRWRLEPVVDSLTYRKLPSLWLCVTCYADLGTEAPVSVLLRPTGNEFFSPNRGYAHELPPPDGCPAHARVATPVAGAPPVPLGPVGMLLGEQATKEVLLSARGVRVVRQVGEARQGAYRVGRRIDLGAPVVDADDLARVCDAMVATVTERAGVAS
ncbi:MAG: hypothetical protein GEV10_26695 [Streptosporangiales bacterium]|nr:hypothetical protein [Streptosporangiales bacterium]